MSPEEQDRIDDQIAEAREIIQRERNEYKVRQEEDKRREQRTAVDEDMDHDTAASPAGGNRDADLAQSHSGGNEVVNGGGTLTQDHEMKDEEVEGIANHAVEPQNTEEPAMDTRSPEPEANADEPSKDADEEVVEAAEDTVIY